MKVVKKIAKWKSIREKIYADKKSLGFVPTMGAIHKGHLALIKRSLKENDVTVVSIFINPTQFNNKDDLDKYPKDIESDIKAIGKYEVDYLLLPGYKEIYPDNYKYKVIETDFSKTLCGKYREGHFDGVLTVVLKLLNLVKPDKAYFGKKDYQQLKLIKGMTEAFFMNIKIVAVPTVRSKDGLALSSRNARFSKKDLKKASEFPRLLNQKLPLDDIKFLLEEIGFEVEYIEEIDNRRYGAVYLNGVRLIDNVKI